MDELYDRKKITQLFIFLSLCNMIHVILQGVENDYLSNVVIIIACFLVLITGFLILKNDRIVYVIILLVLCCFLTMNFIQPLSMIIICLYLFCLFLFESGRKNVESSKTIIYSTIKYNILLTVICFLLVAAYIFLLLGNDPGSFDLDFDGEKYYHTKMIVVYLCNISIIAGVILIPLLIIGIIKENYIIMALSTLIFCVSFITNFVSLLINAIEIINIIGYYLESIIFYVIPILYFLIITTKLSRRRIK